MSDPKQKLAEKRMAKHRRKQKMKSIIAIILVILMVGMAIAPIFAETQEEDYHAYIDFMMEYLHRHYHQPIEQQDLINGLYRGMFDALDPYSAYMTPDEYERWETSMEGSFSGIGASITEGTTAYVEILAPIPGTPAEAAGLMPGDRIVSIDGESARGFTTEQAVSRIRGEEGTAVLLGIARDGELEILEIEIVRAMIIIDTVNYEIDDTGVGYIRIHSFGQNTNDEFDRAMAHMVNNDVTELILDLRNNPGGYLNSAIHISDYFVPQGTEIVRVTQKSGSDRIYRARRSPAPVELVVLVNEFSASASEIVSGSIREAGTGTLYGTTTFGKGTVQNLIPLANGGAMKITTSEYKLRDGVAVNGVGVAVDHEVKAMRRPIHLAPIDPAQGITTLNLYAAQQRLQLLHLEVEASGQWNDETLEALKVFQAYVNLPQTGQLNLETLKALEALQENPLDLELMAARNHFRP